MRTFAIVAISVALCAATLAAPDAQNRRQALFVRQQRQQPSEGYSFNRPDQPLLEEPAPTRDSNQQGSVDAPSREYLPLPSAPNDKPRPFVPAQRPQPAPITGTNNYNNAASNNLNNNVRPATKPQVSTGNTQSSSGGLAVNNFQTGTFQSGGSQQTVPQTTTRPQPQKVAPVQDSSSSAATQEEEHEHHHHGAHIENIDVVCAKDKMTIKLLFSGPFEGVIYSKGFYNQPNCRYLEPNSGRANTEFTVNLDSCGTQFVDDFATGGEAYLENVLVLQNEPGIQEVWDTIRRVRCLWAGNIKEALSTSLNVDVLNQEVVTFSGDTASARLDIQIGRGPFASPANGLVKIGETMTLVVTVDGDPDFDVSVGECVAHAGNRDEGVKLTDVDGCPLKAKLFPDPFVTTKDTQGTGASVLAYAFFQAFKFPDQMELNIECEVELCKTGCRICPRGVSPEVQKAGARNKRAANTTDIPREFLADPVRLVRKVHVVTDDDLALLEESSLGASTIINVSRQQDGICVSMSAFVLGSMFLLVLLASASMTSACLWLKNQRMKGCGA